MREVNYLFIIGAPKCGTTSLAAMLDRHPAVSLARGKEPRFFTDYATRAWTGAASGFADDIPRDDAAYEDLFVDGASWRVDASTDYLSNAVAPQRVRAFAGQPGVGRVLIVVVLRDPIARIVSEYLHTVREGWESGTLDQAIDREDARAASGDHPLFAHLRRSHYAADLARWRGAFGDDLIVLDHAELDLGGSTGAMLFERMGLAALRVDEVPRKNAASYPRSRWLNRIRRHRATVGLARAVLPDGLRGRLRHRVDDALRGDYAADPATLDRLRDLLADEIAACRADPDIPTENWRLARAHDPSSGS